MCFIKKVWKISILVFLSLLYCSSLFAEKYLPQHPTAMSSRLQASQESDILRVSVLVSSGSCSADNSGNNKVDVQISYLIDESTNRRAPAAGILTIHVDGEEVPAIGDDGVLNLSLEPGEHEVIAFAVGEYANVKTIIVEEGSDAIEILGVLKSEALGLVLDHYYQIVGLDDEIVVDQPSLVIESIDNNSGERRLVGELSGIRIVRIENGSFSEGIGGRDIGGSSFLQNQFEVIDGRIVAINPQRVFDLIRNLSSGEYVIYVGASDDQTGLPLDGLIHIVL